MDYMFDRQCSNKLSILKLKIISKRNPKMDPLHVQSQRSNKLSILKLKISIKIPNELHVQNQLSFDHQRFNKLSILKLKIISKKNPKMDILHVQNKLSFDRQ